VNYICKKKIIKKRQRKFAEKNTEKTKKSLQIYQNIGKYKLIRTDKEVFI